MKSVIKENNNQKEIKYPCLMENKENGVIILRIDKYRGTLIHKGRESRVTIGNIYHNMDVHDEVYIPFNGTIELSND